MLHPLGDSKRSAEIAAVFTRFGGGVLLRSLGLGGTNGGEQTLTPERLRRALETLGPVFVKLGQILSTRRDLISAEWADELAKLQSSVGALPWDVMSPRIDALLGASKEDVFAEFDPEPIGSASIGQVYRARLKDGRAVVVKVTRPGQEALISADLRLLELAAAQAERFSPDLARYRPRAMVQELSRAIHAELDLTEEASNGEEVAANLAHLPDITIPGIHRGLSSRDLLVQDLVDGIPPKDKDRIAAEGLDGSALARAGADAFMNMVLVDRVFHADPHPGNLFALPGNRVAFIDFGMVGRLTKARQRELTSLLRAIVAKDAAGLSRSLLAWGEDGEARQDRLEADSARFVARHARAGLDLSRAVGDLMDMVRNANLSLPADLVLLLKALATADGTMKLLDPDFDTIAAARPFVEREVLSRLSPDEVMTRMAGFGEEALALAEDSPALIKGALSRVSEGKLRAEIVIPENTDIAGALERSGKRIAVAVVIAAFAIGIAPGLIEWGPAVFGLHLGAWAGLAIIVAGILWLLGIGWFSRRG